MLSHMQNVQYLISLRMHFVYSFFLAPLFAYPLSLPHYLHTHFLGLTVCILLKSLKFMDYFHTNMFVFVLYLYTFMLAL